jgi:hypothetical protein
MQRCTVAHRRQHGLGEPGVVRRTAARSRIDDSWLADDSAVPGEAHAHGDLIVVVGRAPASGEPRRNAVDAGDERRLRLDGLRLRSKAQRDDGNRDAAARRETARRLGFAAREHDAFARNRHREERSDAAIPCPCVPSWRSPRCYASRDDRFIQGGSATGRCRTRNDKRGAMATGGSDGCGPSCQPRRSAYYRVGTEERRQ